ncbi:UbiA prenyltransferase [Macrolepiota fuliginosa MF-IS2]|uniref:UbiA prenyltransferase n=1 Tax=Macrolepiota fuliginosa MF-IS2 TaxID=1400762 RepID=A0A9P6C721_9AGAR|nr:UbiA prenyltransferase [Macrolepiota fuliginosa MF-IS2]
MTSPKVEIQSTLPHTHSLLKSLFSLPTRTECQASWELCRLHNNIGFWVVWLPTAWSITMAYCAYGQKNISVLDVVRLAGTYVPLCFGIKSLIMAIDDILDADVDGLVQRTKMRPLPRGAITAERAWLFFFLQVVMGVYVAYEFLPPPVRRISMWAWPLYIIYPTCKRWTNLAPIPLGLMFNIGVFMGWVHTMGSDEATPWTMLRLVYLAACLWTFTYETVYQHQDKKDDIIIGLHSPALLLGSYTKPICATTGLGFFALFAYAGWLNGQGVGFFIALLCAAAMLFSKLITTNIDVPNDCREFFLKTVPIGQVILIGLVVDAGVITWAKSQ